MGVNWLAGLHHSDRPGRRRAMPVFAGRETACRGRHLQGGRQTAVIIGQIRSTTLSRHWSRRAEQWWRGIT
jgi:hypothetical protein